MPKNRIIITLGILIALLPVLGFPMEWEAVFQVGAGLAIVVLSALIVLDKRMTQRAKARARQARRPVVEAPQAQKTEEVPPALSQEVGEDQNVLDTKLSA